MIYSADSVELPEECTQTRAAVENFGIGSLPGDLIRSMAEVKKAALAGLQEFEHYFSDNIYRQLEIVLDQMQREAAELDMLGSLEDD